MSVQDLRKFAQMCEENEAVRNKAKEIGLNDLDGQIAYGKELGFDFSEEDVNVLARESGIDPAELNEEQLEQVAGGGVVAAACGIGMLAVAVVGLGIEVHDKFSSGEYKSPW